MTMLRVMRPAPPGPPSGPLFGTRAAESPTRVGKPGTKRVGWSRSASGSAGEEWPWGVADRRRAHSGGRRPTREADGFRRAKLRGPVALRTGGRREEVATGRVGRY